jgi:hypothetical protein
LLNLLFWGHKIHFCEGFQAFPVLSLGNGSLEAR